MRSKTHFLYYYTLRWALHDAALRSCQICWFLLNAVTDVACGASCISSLRNREDRDESFAMPPESGCELQATYIYYILPTVYPVECSTLETQYWSAGPQCYRYCLI